MKICFIDTETTGLSSYSNAMVQCSGIIRIDGRIKKRFDLKFKPHEGARIDVNQDLANRHRLLSSHGFQRFVGMLEDYVDPYDKKDKMYFVAYNARFDEDFIRAWFKRNNNNFYGSYFWNPSVCVYQLVAHRMMMSGVRPEMENMKLSTICKYYGIRIDETRLHDAAYDTLILKNLWNKLHKTK